MTEKQTVEMLYCNNDGVEFFVAKLLNFCFLLIVFHYFWLFVCVLIKGIDWAVISQAQLY